MTFQAMTAHAIHSARATRLMPGSSWCNSIVAPRTARHPAGKARRLRISGIFDGGATQSAGMHRRSNADGVAPRAAKIIASPDQVEIVGGRERQQDDRED